MIGIIGGSGFYDFIENPASEVVDTPFGKVELETGSIGSTEILFLPRHGKNHSIPPHLINYRANIYAAHLKSVSFLLATNAVGSLHMGYNIGEFAIITDIIDFTKGRVSTFFDGTGFSIMTNSGKKLSGVVHTDVSKCYNEDLNSRIQNAANDLGINIHNKGVVVVSNGPRFESPAEIKAYGKMEGDFIGMTSAPEVFLAKELDIPYASVGVITNFASGLQKTVSAEEVFTIFSRKIQDIKTLFQRLIENSS